MTLFVIVRNITGMLIPKPHTKNLIDDLNVHCGAHEQIKGFVPIKMLDVNEYYWMDMARHKIQEINPR
jgi:hypothetical protein